MLHNSRPAAGGIRAEQAAFDALLQPLRALMAYGPMNMESLGVVLGMQKRHGAYEAARRVARQIDGHFPGWTPELRSPLWDCWADITGERARAA